MESSADAPLEVLWQQVLEQWESEEVHDAFLDAAFLCRALPFAASRYRQQKANPLHADRAEIQLTKITVQAFSLLEASRAPAPDHKKTINRIAIGVSAALIAGSIFAMTR